MLLCASDSDQNGRIFAVYIIRSDEPIRRARRKKPQRSTISYRRNRQIRVPNLRLIDENGENKGVVSTSEALDMAYEAELDLVEVAPNANPPVARITDYSKFVYEKTRREREARKNRKKVEIKTIKLKLKTADFHRGIQVRKARGWLEEGKKVKVEIRFYGREITYPELGHEIMNGVFEELKDVGAKEQEPNLEGRNMIMMLAPAKE
jgi:translation initiation factor IF-3